MPCGRPARAAQVNTNPEWREAASCIYDLPQQIGGLSPATGFCGFRHTVNINAAGFIIAGMFLLTWLAALLIRRSGRIEERWTASPRPAPVRPRAGAAACSGPVPVRWDRAGTAPALDKRGHIQGCDAGPSLGAQSAPARARPAPPGGTASATRRPRCDPCGLHAGRSPAGRRQAGAAVRAERRRLASVQGVHRRFLLTAAPRHHVEQAARASALTGTMSGSRGSGGSSSCHGRSRRASGFAAWARFTLGLPQPAGFVWPWDRSHSVRSIIGGCDFDGTRRCLP
jgi:hypothetical protein